MNKTTGRKKNMVKTKHEEKMRDETEKIKSAKKAELEVRNQKK